MKRLFVSTVALLLLLAPSLLFAQERVIPSSRVSTHLNVRTTPNVNSDIVGTLQPGQSAELLNSVP